VKKDIITKEILKNIAKELSKHILKIPINEEIELIDKEFTRIEKRDADLLFRSGENIIHIEIQNNNHRDMHKRMLRYYSDIFFEYEKYTISQYMIYIGYDSCQMDSTITRDNIDFSYGIIDMRNIPCEEFLKSNDPSAVALAILCDFEEKDKQLVVNTILKKLKQLSIDELSFRSHLKMVEVLSTNRNLETTVKKGEEMLNVDVEKLPSFNIGLEKGIMLVAQQMIKAGMDIETIRKMTNLSIEQIEALRKKEK
jgi:predicted transposase/invertase (TIGR01784 family)